MTILFVASLAMIALCVLWLPTYSLALLLRNLGAPQPFADLRTILPLQLVAAVVLVALAAVCGLHDPAAYTLTILLVLSLAGTVTVWRRRLRGI